MARLRGADFPNALPKAIRGHYESLSGLSLEDVRVHYDSPKPRRWGANALTEGSEIHLGPGQRQHLRHEAWHVVQQKQGRVGTTLRVGSHRLNVEGSLEREADAMADGASIDPDIARAASARVARSASSALLARPLPAGPMQAHGWWGALFGGASTGTVLGTAGIGAGLALGAYGFHRWWTRDRRAHQNLAGRLGELEGYQHQQGNGAAGRLTQQYQQLHEAEQQAHQWLRNRNRHASREDRQGMYDVLHRINEHRKTLVGHTIQGNHQMWLPDTVSQQEAGRARGIWNSIRAQGVNANIRLTPPQHGAQAWRTGVLSDMSKLLQSQHGRDMLDELNAQQPNANRQIRIGENWDGVYDENEAGPWARPIGDDPQAQRQAHGLGLGSGSHVQIPAGPANASKAGLHDEEVPSTTYVTLGHELGHARRSFQGRKRDVAWDQPGDPTDPNGLTQNMERQLWNRPEEFENISQQENPIRRQLGLPERRYHRGHEHVVRTRQRHGLRLRLEQLINTHGEDALENLPGFVRAQNMAMGYPVHGFDWNDQGAFQQAHQAMTAVERQAAAL